MISESQIAYGFLVLRQGRSRFLSVYQLIRRDVNDRISILKLEFSFYIWVSKFTFGDRNKKYPPKNQIVVTKADVINEISDKTGIDKADVQASVEAFFTVVKNNMANGENVYVRGFGSFVNKKRAKKIARNISKNTAIVIDEHFIPSFKPSKLFVEKIKKSTKIR